MAHKISPIIHLRVVLLSSWLLLLGLGACGSSAPASDSALPGDGPTMDQGGDHGADAAARLDTGPLKIEILPGCNPFATSEECILPFPSAFFQRVDPQSPTGVRMDYPASALKNSSGEPALKASLTNSADGSSPAGPILLHFGVDIAPEQLVGQREPLKSLRPDSPIALFDLDADRRVMFMSEMDQNRIGGVDGRYALIIRPMEPMEMGHRHAVVLTRALTDEAGAPLPSPRAFEVLRDQVPTATPEIESIRAGYEELFGVLESKGYARQELLLAWDFTVASETYLTGSVLSMRETTLAEIAAEGVSYQITDVEESPNSDAARVIQGTFTAPTFLTADSDFDYDEDHHPVRQAQDMSFPFAMIIPQKALTTDQPLPLVVFGHGLFGSGAGYLAGWGKSTFSRLAKEGGAILIGTDWIGLSEADLQLIISQVIPDPNRLALVTDRLQQSLINNLALTELALGALATDPAVKVSPGPLVDPEQVYYFGVSLGGIQGSSLVSISPRFTRAVLAVPGCGWANLLARSVNWNMIDSFVRLHYPDPLTKQLFIAFIQSWFDLSDPINLSRHLYRSPLPDSPAGRVVLLQESIGDSQVPNMTTEILARAMGVKQLEPSVLPIEGLTPVTSPSTEPVIVQYHMVAQAQADPPPESNVPPATDNEVHSDVLFLPHVLEQTLHFLGTGETRQLCSGPCDPD